MIYLIRVNRLLHHGTSKQAFHESYAAHLRTLGHDVTTESVDSFCHETSHMARNGANVNALGSPAMAVTIRGDGNHLEE